MDGTPWPLACNTALKGMVLGECRIHKDLVFRTLRARLSWLRLTVLALLAGILLSIGVAWLCASTSRYYSKDKTRHNLIRIRDGRIVGYVGQISLVETTYHWGIEPGINRSSVNGLEITELGEAVGLPRWGPLAEALDGYPSRVVGSSFQRAYGLPFRSLFASAETDLRGRDVYSNAVKPEWLTASTWWHGTQTGLPIGILPLGMLFNVVVFGMLFCIVCLIYMCMCTCKRLRKGKCPLCKYEMGDLLVSLGCPECGWNRAPGDVAACRP
jgi:hypothetical protein